MLGSWEVRYFCLARANALMGATIFSKITEVQFGSLQNLSLRGNHIQTLESLHRTHMPELKTLLIGENRLVWVRDFRKLNCPRFSNFDMERNYIIDCQRLTELQTEEEMEEWDLEWYPQCHEMSSDARWAVRLKAQKLNNLCRDAIMK